MAILKCKMCGGDIVVNEEKTYGMCDYCGSTMTLPKVSDDQRAARFNRGNHFRRQGDFDKALAVYETIVNEDDADAEAHWCCALCRFGIEYVEDPNTFEYLPTCHRASFDSFLEDADYLAALEYSDGITKRQYQKDAAKIALIQRGILATSQNEEPYDVFICYKETDDSTKERTRDSLDAQDIYYQLTQEGFRVFFSRITLEDKVGTEYEPYIFAALNSAKVMIVIGSKPEYFNAVWVKNEWSRFLAMMRKDRSKLLLPCYKDMDPYDLPEQLGVLQSYDMAKIGFVQDLIRGVKKVLRKAEPKTSVIKEAPSSNSNAVALLKRASMSLEDGEWDKAIDFCDRALNIEPENSKAYLYIALAKTESRNKEAFAEMYIQDSLTVNVSKELRRATQFDSKMNDWFTELKKQKAEENERKKAELAAKIAAQKAESYFEACELQATHTEEKLLKAIHLFEMLDGYKDSIERIEECRRVYEEKKAEHEAERKNKERAAQIERLALTRKRISPYQHLISAGSNHTVGLKYDGTVLSTKITCEKTYDLGQCNVNGWQNIIAVSASVYHTLGLMSDGKVTATKITNDYLNNRSKWDRSQCNVDNWHDIVQISAGMFYSVGLRKDGKVLVTGENKNGRCNVTKWTDIVKIAACSNHTVGVKSNGTAVAVGNNEYGQCNVSSWTDIVDIAVGDDHTVGLKSDGTVVAVGCNTDGRCNVSYWSDIVAIAAGGNNTVGLRMDGTVVAIGNDKYDKCNVSGWNNIVAVSTGGSNTVGLRSDGMVVAVGNNYSGRCNVGRWKLFFTNEEKETNYMAACKLQESQKPNKIKEAADSFKRIIDYKDSAKRAKACDKALLKEEKNNLQTELKNLRGVFANVRRKKIEARLAEIESELKKL